MTLDYWWAHRNNRRNCRLPDLYGDFDVELPGTPETRLAICTAHARKAMDIAAVRYAQKRAWIAAQRGDY